MITIEKSPTADTRTCDWSTVDKEQLLQASLQHIGDVGQGLGFFASLLALAAARHDFDKVSDIDQFHADFQTGFKQTGWWDNHRQVNRHHLDKPDGVPEDVNLIDVLEHIVDCVMAGMARSGSVYELKLPDEVLQRAFANTVELMKANVKVVEPVELTDEDREALDSLGDDFIERAFEQSAVRDLLLDADRDLSHWVQLAKKQRDELPNVDHLPSGPTTCGIQETERLRERIATALAAKSR